MLVSSMYLKSSKCYYLIMKIVAKALVVDSDNNILILYRGMTHPKFPGHPDLPGGEVESGEEWINAVAREISEETGIEINSNSLIKNMEKAYEAVTHVLYSVVVESVKPKVNLSWEHQSYEWLNIDQIMSAELPSGVDVYYSDVVEYLKFKQ